MQDLLTRVPRLNIPPASMQWLAVGGLCAALGVAVILVLVVGVKGGPAPATASKPSSALNDKKSSAESPRPAAPAKVERAPAKPEKAAATPGMPPPREDALRIISWDLSALPAMAGGRADDPSRASWRTSFGSERSTAPEIRYDLKADVVLLQGISDATRLRRFFFPARDWHLIVTRQKLTDTAIKADPASAAAGITGVAIRVRDGLRITAREYFPRIGGEQQADPDAALLAGTAVRVLDRGQSMWLASFAVPSTCAETPAPCAARARLAEWQESKRQLGEPIVIGGMLAASDQKSGDNSQRCERQKLKSDLESASLPPLTADDLAGPGSGCALAIDLPKQENKELSNP